MAKNQLDQAIQKYIDSLDALEKALKEVDSPKLSSEQILDTLIARHAVQVAIDKSNPLDRKILLKNLNRLDNRLRKLFKSINYSTYLAKWRTYLNPSEEAWWWFLDSLAIPWSERYDWLWSFLSLVFLVASVSLAVDVSSQFLSGGPDFVGTLAVIIQSVLTLLAGGGALTKSGQDVIERVLSSLKLPKHWWHEVSFLFSLLLFLGLLSFHQMGLPLIANKYNYFAEQAYIKGQLASAENNFNRALQLNPDYPEANYNLGRVYEVLQQDDRAAAEYQLAVKGEYYKAYHRLARLYILKNNKDTDNYSKAVALLTEGRSKEAQDDEEITYYNRTYMGWARLGQKRYSEAQPLLIEANDINSKLINQQGLAHCLLAQVLDEQRKDEQLAIQMWELCVAKSNQTKPDEDMWIGVARQRLQRMEEK
ncbi:tetratricopeptide repeat protein [Calothrix sp. PCC 7507]|uniref:tetratricopeptide repeat protein n=1 Tax=Calothrix sp. PCC 7507 TaxID=99598 RepID=UPI00029ECB77|nr:tetratricopeptide repeat protein [Calothrix sp. PCC 7507]AFY30927.1 tetratricopeptide TPR_2 [Calothrix sp. PCC 7507]